MQLSNILVSIIGVWTLVLSVVLWLIYLRFNKLTKEVPEGNLLKILEKVIKKEDENEKAISDLGKELSNQQSLNLTNVQKVGLVRYNPYNEVGGDHSFSIALLTGLEHGFILTGLHARERTRLYVKPIKSGKSEYDLSKEEKKALTLALK